MISININKLRHIESLTFNIPSAGVWLLTGTNGTGKSSILGCLRRIGYKNAFPVHFPASSRTDQIDSNEGASIEYQTKHGSVAYTYRTERWVPTPKSGSSLLENLGYPEVIYIAADAERIEPRKEDFTPRKVTSAPSNLIDAANRIFNTNKFNTLKTVNARTGIGSQAFLLELASSTKAAKKYFSEKNFSLGELCVLKLLRKLANCKRGALILVDEIELALHPTAQAELLDYLNDIAKEKALTVIVSTHSATLIKRSNRNQILFLEKNSSGKISCTKGCFPSYVLGTLAYTEESAPDIIIYVEDESARAVTEQFTRRFLSSSIPHKHLTPEVCVIAVGGINEVLRFYIRQKPLLSSLTKSCVILDADAEATLEKAQKSDIRSIYNDKKNIINFLPFTPEIGLAQYLYQSREDFLKELREKFNTGRLQIRARDVPTPPKEDEENAGSICKEITDSICELISTQIPNTTHLTIKETLLKILAEIYFSQNKAEVMRLFSTILK